ncbi:hypothetical protein ACVWXM_005092 [Bradyrhizobium sp. GM7.3]
MPPVSAISGTIGPSLAASARLMHARDLGRSGEDDSTDIGVRGQCGADAAVASDEVQCACGDAGLVQQPHRLDRDARGLLCGLGHHAVAGHQRRRDLAEEDRQRKIPWRDCHEDAAAAHGQRIALAGRARHRHIVAEQLATLRGIIAAEVGGLAQLRQRIVERLAALALQQRYEMGRAVLQKMRGLLQRRRARVAAGVRLQAAKPARAAATAALA